MAAPAPDPRRATELTAELARAASALAPDWIGVAGNGDFGAALYRIAARLAEQVTRRMDRAPDRDRLAFYEALELPGGALRAATVPIAFTLADKRDARVDAPAGLQLAARVGAVPFETCEAIQITPARIGTLMAVDPASDRLELAPAAVTAGEPRGASRRPLRTLTPSSAGSTTLQLAGTAALVEDDLLRIGGPVYRVAKVEADIVTLADPLESAVAAEYEVALVENLEAFTLRNAQQHVVYIGHKELLNLEQPATIELHFDPAAIAARLVALDMAVEIWATRETQKEPAWHALGADSGAGALRLTKSWFGPVEQVEIDGRKSRWLRIRLQSAIDPDGPPQTLVKKISMIVASSEPPADDKDPDKPADDRGMVKAAFHNALPLSLNGPFYPFGPEPQRFDTFALAAPEALSKPEAQVTVTVSLADATPVALALAVGRSDRAYGIGSEGALHAFVAEPNEQTGVLPRLVWRRLDAQVGTAGASGASQTPERFLLGTGLPLAAVRRDSERDLVIAADRGGQLWASFVTGSGRRLQLGAWVPLGMPEALADSAFTDFALVADAREAVLVALTTDSLWFLTIGGTDSPAPGAWTKPASGGILFGEAMSIAPAIAANGPAFLPPALALTLIDASGDIYQGLFAPAGGSWSIVWRNLIVKANPGVRPLMVEGGGYSIVAAEPLPANPVEPAASPLLALYVRPGFPVQHLAVPPIEVRSKTALAGVVQSSGGPLAVVGWTGAEIALWLPGVAVLPMPMPSDAGIAAFFSAAGTAPAFALAPGTSERVLRRVLPRFEPLDIDLFDAVPSSQPDALFAVDALPAAVKSFEDSGIVVAGKRLYAADPPRLPAGEVYRVVTLLASFGGTLTSTTKLSLPSGDLLTEAGSFVVLGGLLHEVDSVTAGVATLVQASQVLPGIIGYDVVDASSPRTIEADHEATLVKAESDPGPTEFLLFEPSAVPGAQRVAAKYGAWMFLGRAWASVPTTMSAVPAAAPANWASSQFPREYDSPELAWEYADGKAWRRLDVTDGTANFARSGDITFIVPADLAEIEVAGSKDLWIRARLVGGDYGRARYEIEFDPPTGSPRTETIRIDTSALNPPEIAAISAAFAIANPAEPQTILTRNNLALLDQTQASRAGDARFDLFTAIAAHVARAAGETGEDSAGRALYLRLTKAPDVDLLTCYVDAEEIDVPPAKLAADVLTAGGWQQVRGLDDGTAGLNRPGMIRLPLQADPDELPLFGASGWWLRLRPSDSAADWLPRLRGLFLNAAMAVQAKTLVQELVGSSDGSPDQVHRLAYAPLIPEDLDLRVRERLSDEEREAIVSADGEDAVAVVPDIAGTWIRWRQRDSFAGEDGDARIFRLDPAKGEIQFGDNRRGRIPPAGADAVRAFRYRQGGGSSGNVEAGEIRSVKSAVQSLDRAVNPVAASGGADIEPDERIEAAAVARLRHSGRLLAPPDVEAFARASAPDVAAARCLPGDGGGFTLIVSLRRPDVRAARVSRARREGLAAALAEHGSGAVPVERIVVRSPVYVRTAIRAELVVASGLEAAAVQGAAHRALSDLLDPTLGPGGEGGRFGLGIEEADVYRALACIKGLDRIESIAIEGGPVGSDALAYGEEEDAEASVRIGGSG